MLLYLRDMNIIYGNLQPIRVKRYSSRGNASEAMHSLRPLRSPRAKSKTLGLAAQQGRSDLQNSV